MRHTLDPEIIRRLDNLTQMQRLTPKGRRDIIVLLDLLEVEYGVSLTSRQAEMFINHLSETFRRLGRGEPAELMEATTAGQIRSFGGSGIVDQMMRDFCRITGNRFPISEEEYLKMYLSSLLSYGNEAVMLEKLITETEKEMRLMQDAATRNDLQELDALTHHLRSSWEVLRADQPLRELYGLLHGKAIPEESELSHAVTAVLNKGAEIIRLAKEERRKYENG